MPDTEFVAVDNAYQPVMTRIVRVFKFTDDTNLYQLRFADREVADRFSYLPGQFVKVSVLGTGEAPISISSTPTRPGIIELCIRRVGRVTEAFHRLGVNAVVGIRGPYGNGWPLEKMVGKNLLIVAGGLGLAAVRSLLGYALDNRADFGEITLVYGARTPEDLLFRDELASFAARNDMKVLLTVDRDPAGTWPGRVGVVTKLFDEVEMRGESSYAAVCVPPVAFKFVAPELLSRGFAGERILMSLERKMNCGIGKCGYCRVGSKYTCLDGPVFTYWDAANMPELI